MEIIPNVNESVDYEIEIDVRSDQSFYSDTIKINEVLVDVQISDTPCEKK